MITPTDLTEEQLAELDSLLAKATPLPWKPCEHWRADDCGCGKHRGYLWAPDGERVILQMGCETDEAGQQFPSPDKQESRNNIHLISNARNALPSLLAEVRRHRNERAKASFAVGQLRHLFSMMVRGAVLDTKQAARGLLGPAIEKLEPLTQPAPTANDGKEKV